MRQTHRPVDVGSGKGSGARIRLAFALHFDSNSYAQNILLDCADRLDVGNIEFEALLLHFCLSLKKVKCSYCLRRVRVPFVPNFYLN